MDKYVKMWNQRDILLHFSPTNALVSKDTEGVSACV